MNTTDQTKVTTVSNKIYSNTASGRDDIKRNKITTSGICPQLFKMSTFIPVHKRGKNTKAAYCFNFKHFQNNGNINKKDTH